MDLSGGIFEKRHLGACLGRVGASYNNLNDNDKDNYDDSDNDNDNKS